MAWMSRVLLGLSAMASATSVAAEKPQRLECAHDREAILALELVAFDQTEGSGWRPLYEAGCYREAAKLVRDWRARHGDVHRILPFHEAQLWGYAGRGELAIPLFEREFRAITDEGSIDWKLYTEGNLAFLQRDRARLEAATARLAALPRPANWGNLVDANGNRVERTWPLNLDVMQALARCWDAPYVVAAHCHIPDWRLPGGAD